MIIPNDCESGGHEIRTRNPRKGRLISNEVANHSHILQWRVNLVLFYQNRIFRQEGGELGIFKGAFKIGGHGKGICLETFSKPSDYSVLIPTSLDVGNKNNSKIVAPRFIWGTKQRRHSPNASVPLPSPRLLARGREGTSCVILCRFESHA